MKKRFLALLLAFCLVLSLCTVSAFADGDNTTKQETSVASVTQTTDEGEKTTYYDTLAAAITAATADGATVTLLEDTSGSGIVIDSSKYAATGLTIDFGGFTYTVNQTPLAGSTGTESQCFQLKTGGSVTMKNGSIKADNSGVKMIIQNYCNLTLDGMTLDATQGTNSVNYVLSNNCGNVTIEDTAITAKENGVAFDVYGGFMNYGNVSVTVTGESEIYGTVEVNRKENQSNTNNNTLLIEDGATVCGDVSVKAGTSATIDGATIYGKVTVAENSTAAVTVQDSVITGSVSASATVLNSKVQSKEVEEQVPEGVVALVNGVTYTSLSDAITAAGTDGTVTLLKNVELTTTQEIISNVTINLNGKTIKGNNVRVFQVKSGTLTLTGTGTVTTEAAETDSIADSSSVIRVGDASTNDSAAGLVIDSDVTIKAPATYGVTVFGKNSELTLDVKGVVEASGTEPAISGNGLSGLTSTTITIESGAKVSAGNETTATAAIYQPQAGTLTIKDGATVTSSNGAGIVARSGNIVIEGGTISGGGTGNFTVGDSEVEVPKSAVVYDFSANYPGLTENEEPVLSISGGSFTAGENVETISIVVSNKDKDEDEKTDEVTITGGTFLSGEVVDDSVTEYLASGLQLNSSGKVVRTSNSGGSSSGTTAYSISVSSSSNGSVSASAASAGKGETVTLTVSPDDGCELSVLTVTDAGGNKLALTDQGDGKYTFTMPDSKVTVSAVFETIETAHDCPSGIFTDVDISQYYHEAVDWAVLSGVTTGTAEATFEPNASCTRAQMVTFLWRAAGCPAPTTTENPFTDVSSGAYYYDAVLWGVENGVIHGTSATTFSPNETVTRGQTVTFLYRYAGSPAVSGGNNFTDVSANAYYADAVQWGAENGVVYGTSATTFEPESSCKRAQIVTLLYRAIAD